MLCLNVFVFIIIYIFAIVVFMVMYCLIPVVSAQINGLRWGGGLTAAVAYFLTGHTRVVTSTELIFSLAFFPWHSLPCVTHFAPKNLLLGFGVVFWNGTLVPLGWKHNPRCRQLECFPIRAAVFFDFDI